MNSFIDFLNNFLPFAYLVTFGAYSFDFMKGGKRRFEFARLSLFITLVIHLIYLLARTAEFNHPPITNVFEIFTILAFAVSFSYFILELVTDIRGTGPFIIIIPILFQLISSIFIEDLTEVKEVLRSNLLGSHVFTALMGYAGFTISAVYGFLYLILYKDIKLNKFGLIFNKLPNLEILERLSYISAVIGFILLTISMIIGVIWLPSAFPDFSYLDPKLIGSSLVWLLYAIGIASKIFVKWRGRKLVFLSITGFVVAIISTFLSNFLAKSFHSFY
ncbi:MAG TPA: cytochrome c biogenesis protein CcsA [Ignavibacteriaceae bacterium]|jgi:ABC-type transport system involved in cytochrome c biogenesis permease subunit